MWDWRPPASPQELVWDWVPKGFPKKQAVTLGLGKRVQNRDSSHKRATSLEQQSWVLIWSWPSNCCVIFNRLLDISVATSSNVRREQELGFCSSSYLNLLRTIDSPISAPLENVLWWGSFGAEPRGAPILQGTNPGSSSLLPIQCCPLPGDTPNHPTPNPSPSTGP